MKAETLAVVPLADRNRASHRAPILPSALCAVLAMTARGNRFCSSLPRLQSRLHAEIL